MSAWQSGAALGPYVLEALVGAGGMGEVWRARDTRLNRTVAIKRLKRAHSGRFEQEAHAIAALNHPHICQIYDIGPDYLVLEFVEGKPLSGPIAPEVAVRLALEIVSAVEEAHGKGILHRDLKPNNILMTSKGAKLLDFGLAKLESAPPDSTLTVEGTVMGTAAYMSPEQAHGMPIDERSEVFSIGAVLYEMLSGKRAFEGNSMLEILNAVVRTDPPPIEGPNALRAVVTRCLRKSPTERFPNMTELRAALAAAVPSPAREGRLAPSIAVLPFANLSADAEQEYFSDGLAEEIINALVQAPGLKVIARTSSFAFKGQNTDVRRIGETLGVAHILDGSVRKAGTRVRVMAQLITAADGTHLWSDRYDRDLTDVFAVQDEIAAAIATALHVKLSGARKVYVPRSEAHEALLKGRHLWNKRTVNALTKAVQHYQEALGYDPGFALAFAGIADCYLNLGTFTFVSPQVSLPRAKTAAMRALELDPTLGETQATLACLRALYDWDWPEAEREFERAITLNPKYSVARQWYGACLCAMGQFAAGREQLRAAVDLDPLSPMIGTQLAVGYYLERRYEDVIRECKNVLDLDPQFWAAWHFLGLAHETLGRFDDAIAALRKAVHLSGETPFASASLGHACARSAKKDDAECILLGLRGRSQSEYVPPYSLSLICCGLGRLDDALAYLEQAYEERSPTIALWLRGERRLDPLRSEPQFQRVLQGAGLT